jgi:5,5'-dehydrodivanillate O-demethylase
MLGFGQIRVPIDDFNTWHITYMAGDRTSSNTDATSDVISVKEVPLRHPDGRLMIETVLGGDMMAWVTQGPLTPRSQEALGVSDRGIILYRNMLSDAIEAVERGEDPPAIIRDPEKNKVLTWKTEADSPKGGYNMFALPGQEKAGGGFPVQGIGYQERKLPVTAPQR